MLCPPLVETEHALEYRVGVNHRNRMDLYLNMKQIGVSAFIDLFQVKLHFYFQESIK